MGRPRKTVWIFIILSAVLVLGEGAFVTLNALRARAELEEDIQQNGRQIRDYFTMVVNQTQMNMLAIATFIASDHDVQKRFLQGRLAVEAEGGGPGKEQAAHWRALLLDEVSPGWQRVHTTFQVRQIHFHLGPGDVSFLRVHRPEKFGDVLNSVRPIIVDTNRERVPRSGFELGRTFAGLRGVVPVVAWDPVNGLPIHVGAVEVGTTFETVLSILSANHNAGAGILLDRKQAQRSLWPEDWEQQFGHQKHPCDCVIVATSRSELPELIAQATVQGMGLRVTGTDLLTLGSTHYAVTHFPLRDYRGEFDPGVPSAGMVMLWQDVTADLTGLDDALLENILYAMIGLVVLEGCLFLGLRLSVAHMQRTIAERTNELREAKERMEVMAQTDPLTTLSNRLRLDRDLAREISLTQRYGAPFSLIMLDIDRFKAVNDTYGHQVGDRVLVEVSRVIKSVIRSSDIAGRWGGEEFMILCPHTDRDQAERVAEKLRAAIEQTMVDPVGQVTASFGVSTLRKNDDTARLVLRADEALYSAKESGRNRVMIAA